jgi:peptide deformylase
MAVLPVLQAPHPTLRQKAQPVARFDEELSIFVADLIETMYAHKGAGIAAPQVGRSIRVCLVHTPEDGLLVLVNPVIVRRSGSQVGPEGCLSMEGVSKVVRRAETVEVRAFDEIGDPLEGTLHGLTARALQHEIDHLDGILMTDFSA